MVVQGMYIFKLPGGMGGPCTPHQDGSFLINEPTRDTLVKECFFLLVGRFVEFPKQCHGLFVGFPIKKYAILFRVHYYFTLL